MIEYIDIPRILLLVFLEGILSMDNALAISLIVRELPVEKRKKALFVGLGSAVVLRGVALVFAIYFIHYTAVQVAGALYLLYLAFKHRKVGEAPSPSKRSFWKAVVAIELTDFAFAFDSIIAGIGLVGVPPKLWVVYLGGVLGIVMMRVAITFFVSLLHRFPRLERVAHLIIGLVAVKLGLEAFHLIPMFWGELIFYLAIISLFTYGFYHGSRKKS